MSCKILISVDFWCLGHRRTTHYSSQPPPTKKIECALTFQWNGHCTQIIIYFIYRTQCSILKKSALFKKYECALTDTPSPYLFPLPSASLSLLRTVRFRRGRTRASRGSTMRPARVSTTSGEYSTAAALSRSHCLPVRLIPSTSRETCTVHA